MKNLKRITSIGILIGLPVLVAEGSLAQSVSPSPAHSLGFDLGENAKALIQVVGILFGAVVSVVKLINLMNKSRSSLKADIELFKLLKEDDPGYETMRKHIGDRIDKTYSLKESSGILGWLGVNSTAPIVLGVLTVLGFTVWTAYLFRSGHPWWSLLTGYFALTGVGLVQMGFRKKHAPRKRQSETDGHPNPVLSDQPSEVARS